MPRRTPLQFPVLAFTVVTLACFAIGRYYLNPLLAPDAENSLASNTEPFLSQAGSEPIDWHTMSDSALSQAKLQDRLILLVMGTSWSTVGQKMDELLFQDDSVNRYLARNFVCIRVDIDDNPQWAGAFLPVSRRKVGLNSQCQILALSPEGKLVSVIERSGVWSLPDASAFLDSLIDSVQICRKAEATEANNGVESTPLGSLQSTDASAITNAAPFEASQATLVQSASSLLRTVEIGNNQVDSYQTIAPAAWGYLTLVAGPEPTQQAIQPLLNSSTVNWLDGGFFWGSAGQVWRIPVFDQPLVPNAQMALLLARLGILNGNALDLELAKRTAYGLLDDFPSPDGYQRMARIAKQSGIGYRSARYSFDPLKLRNTFPALQDRRWVWNNLGLRVETNPSMVPIVSNDNLIADPNLNRYLGIMKKAALPATFDSIETTGANGLAVESLLLASTALNDGTMRDRSADLFDKLDLLHTGKRVVHKEGDSVASSQLLDYLGYAAAALADFESLGRVSSLQSGAEVLHYALTSFPQTTLPGLPAASMNVGPISVIPNANLPQISDDGSESTSALVMRLCLQYSQALQTTKDPHLANLARKWVALSSKLAQVLPSLSVQLGSNGGGIDRAQALALDGRFAVAVGSDPVASANRLFSLAPLYAVYPAIGPVWPGLQLGKPGYYLFVSGKMRGPFNLQTAVAALNAPSALGS